MSEIKKYNSGDVSELVEAARADSDAAFEHLLGLYEPMILSQINRFATIKQDREDARQEALAGFYRAVLTFDLGQPEVAFGLYAKICVTNALITHQRRLKRQNGGGAVETIGYDDAMKHMEAYDSDPAERVIQREAEQALRELISSNLSRYENSVWDMHIAGVATSDISKKLGKPERSIDNALYRIRRKLRTLLEGGGA